MGVMLLATEMVPKIFDHTRLTQTRMMMEMVFHSRASYVASHGSNSKALWLPSANTSELLAVSASFTSGLLTLDFYSVALV